MHSFTIIYDAREVVVVVWDTLNKLSRKLTSQCISQRIANHTIAPLLPPLFESKIKCLERFVASTEGIVNVHIHTLAKKFVDSWSHFQVECNTHSAV